MKKNNLKKLRNLIFKKVSEELIPFNNKNYFSEFIQNNNYFFYYYLKIFFLKINKESTSFYV